MNGTWLLLLSLLNCQRLLLSRRYLRSRYQTQAPWVIGATRA